jgi:hypothetical protein
MIIRIILYSILFYLIYRTIRRVIQFIFPSVKNTEVKGKPQKEVKTFDPNNIEDIDYEEVDKDK